MRALAILCLLALCAFRGAEKEQDFTKVLPGLVKVTENLYYDKTEITNFQWLEYLSALKEEFGESSQEYRSHFPDTLVWRSDMMYNEPYVKYYLNHPAYFSYPVVGVTWLQATDYCAWRTERVKQMQEATGQIDKAPAYFQYRLPRYEEWQMMYADVSKLSDQIGEEGKRKWRGLYRWNMKRGSEDTMGVAGQLNDNADVTAPVESYWPNQYGSYNIKGNVSEWLQEENMHVGGSWRTDMSQNTSTRMKLEGASSEVGFRCACEVFSELP